MQWKATGIMAWGPIGAGLHTQTHTLTPDDMSTESIIILELNHYSVAMTIKTFIVKLQCCFISYDWFESVMFYEFFVWFSHRKLSNYVVSAWQGIYCFLRHPDISMFPPLVTTGLGAIGCKSYITTDNCCCSDPTNGADWGTEWCRDC